MIHTTVLALCGIIAAGVAAQWLAWKLRAPSVLLLLLVGFLAGPVTGLLSPDELLGESLAPLVSLAVAIILYEGGLSLRFSELREAGGVIWRLVTIGALITWAIGAGAAWLLLDLPGELAILLGAVLIVTGPTVVGPLLQHIRPTGPASPALKWEGIVIDPLGALLAVLVFEAIFIHDPEGATRFAAGAVIKTILAGGGFGIAAAFLLAGLLRWFWIPDYLDNAASLAFMLVVYAAAEAVQREAGLFAATIMGVTLANQRLADIRHIAEFKEHLRILLISALFIILAARVTPTDARALGWSEILFVIVLIVLARPLSVLASAWGSPLSTRERIFLAWMAPRGIVAASVASVFALELSRAGAEQASTLVPVTFAVILGTTALYGFTAKPLAHRLGVAEANPQGVIFVGAAAWVRAVAKRLHDEGFRVLLLDTNLANIAAARMEGLPARAESVMSEEMLEEIDLGGIGKVITATPNDWVNLLAVQRFRRVFDRSEVFQLRSAQADRETDPALAGRLLFSKGISYQPLRQCVEQGGEVKVTPLTEEFTLEQFQQRHGDRAILLFYITEARRLIPVADDQRIEPQPGWKVVSLVGDRPQL